MYLYFTDTNVNMNRDEYICYILINMPKPFSNLLTQLYNNAESFITIFILLNRLSYIIGLYTFAYSSEIWSPINEMWS